MRQTQTGRHLQDRRSHLRSAIRCHAVVADRRHDSRTRQAAKPADARHRHDAGGVLRPNRTSFRPRESARPRTDIGCSRTGLRAGRRRWRRHRFHIRRTGGGRVPKVRNRASHGGQRRPSGRDRRIGAFRLLVLPSAATIHRTAGRHVVHHAVGMRVSVGFGIPRAFDGIVRRGMPVHRQTRPGNGVVELDHIGYADGMPAHVAKLRIRPVLRRGARHRAVRRHAQRMDGTGPAHGSWPRLCP